MLGVVIDVSIVVVLLTDQLQLVRVAKALLWCLIVVVVLGALIVLGARDDDMRDRIRRRPRWWTPVSVAGDLAIAAALAAFGHWVTFVAWAAAVFLAACARLHVDKPKESEGTQ